MDERTEAVTRRKFDIAYMMAKEGIAFNKMKSLYELEERHGVNLGDGYKNDLACSSFVAYIAQDLKMDLTKSLKTANFFSIQMDGSTDCANVEEELFLAIYFDPHCDERIVHVRNKYFCVRQLKSVDASGLYECLNRALLYLEVDEPGKLVGFGCDGASVNMGDKRGLRGLLQKDRPWIATVWCLAHRLELSLKDAFRGTLFSEIEDFLMRVYYIYSKAPKKCHELDGVVAELGSCLESCEFPSEGGNRPRRACGTRFIAHKVAAIDRLLDRYGAYMNHLTTLTEDAATRPADKQKLKGYISKWRCAKVVLGCAIFYDILKPAAILCDELCIVSAIEALLQTTAAIEKLKSTNMEEFLSVKKVITRLKKNGVTYQSVELLY